MKVGLIGNMNNNNFVLMRYFQDLGVDAHLLLYLNDGKGSLSHFKPECDSWIIDKWKPFIHQTNIPNSPIAALDFPWSFLVQLFSGIQKLINNIEKPQQQVSKICITNTYIHYDRLIASGISPATLNRVGISLDIFYPYSNGVEFLMTGEFLVRFDSILKKYLLSKVADYQKRGIIKSKKVINSEMGLTQDALTNIGVKPLNLAFPAVYDREQLPEYPITDVCKTAWDVISNSDFTILHHSRLMWKNPGIYSEGNWIKENKNNHWLLHGFAKLISKRPLLNARLLIVEYGPDIEATKLLAAELNILKYIQWMPKMERRELMWIIARVSLCVGEFYEVPRMIWGGTGWEALASGKPILQGFNFGIGEFENIFGYPPPPLLKVKNQDDVYSHLLRLSDDNNVCKQTGLEARHWFVKYNGIELAKQWLDLLINSK